MDVMNRDGAAGRSADIAVRGIVDRLFEIIDGCRWSELPAVFDAECRYDRPGYATFAGLDRLDRFYREERIIARGQHHVEKVVGNVETVACWGRFVGESRDGEPLDEGFADVYELRDGKIVYRRTYFARAAL